MSNQRNVPIWVAYLPGLGIFGTLLLILFQSGTEWAGVKAEMAAMRLELIRIQESIDAASGDRWRGTDTVMYHALAQAAVDAWAKQNDLSHLKLPDPVTIIR